jgi:hypothetical protein
MAIGLVAAATIAVAGLAVWWHNGPPRPTTVTFEPPYPQVNAAGDPILAVFEGRIPCSSPHCERRKVGLVLYQYAATRTPSTYWLGLVGLTGNDRLVIKGPGPSARASEIFPRRLSTRSMPAPRMTCSGTGA